MIKFSNVYYNKDGSINEEDLITDLRAMRILLDGYKKIGDKQNETLIRWEFMKRKALAELHNIKYIPDTKLLVSV
jgi:hypothetical protein